VVSYNLIDDPVRFKVHFSVILHAAFNQFWWVVPSFGLLVQAQYQRTKLFKYIPGIISRVFSRDVLEQVDQIILSLIGETNMESLQ